jgi:hypothetical protein
VSRFGGTGEKSFRTQQTAWFISSDVEVWAWLGTILGLLRAQRLRLNGLMDPAEADRGNATCTLRQPASYQPSHTLHSHCDGQVSTTCVSVISAVEDAPGFSSQLLPCLLFALQETFRRAGAGEQRCPESALIVNLLHDALDRKDRMTIIVLIA